MRSWLLHARESFWFLPALFGLGAIALALGLVEVDRLLVVRGIDDIPLIEDLSATGGRAILSAIGGTMLGVAATSFSITISVLATTSSSYGPRLVRNFMADRGNQLVLAVLTSTFLYSLVVLRSVHTEEDSSLAFVPVIAVSAAVVLAVVDVAVLVYFIHHIATSVQVTTLQARVLDDLERVIDLLHPREAREEDRTHDDDQAGAERPRITAERSGYVERIEIARLVSAARSEGAVYRVLALPGTHVLRGDPLVSAHGAAQSESDPPAALVTLADGRTPHQDLRYAVQQLVEIGVRGLATGTNDPYTAVGAVDALTGALVVLASRGGPRTRYRDEDGVVRLICDWPGLPPLIADVGLAVRSYALDQPLVVRAALRMLERLETVCDGGDRSAVRREVAALAETYGRGSRDPLEREPVTAAFAALLQRLDSPRRSTPDAGLAR